MIHPALRAASAFAAVTAFLGGVAALVAFGGSFLHALPIGLSGLLALPAMFGGAPPTQNDLPRIEEQFRRFHLAMIGCFASAWVLYGVAAIERRRLAAGVVQQIAALGVAFWLVAFVLVFFVVYYRAQRRLARATN